MIIQPSFGGCLHHRIAFDKLPKSSLICQHGVGSPTPWHRWHAQLPPKCGCRNTENHRHVDHRRGASALFPISPILSCSYIQNKPMQNLSLQGAIRISSCPACTATRCRWSTWHHWRSLILTATAPIEVALPSTTASADDNPYYIRGATSRRICGGYS